jgi:hypothetical protein
MCIFMIFKKIENLKKLPLMTGSFMKIGWFLVVFGIIITKGSLIVNFCKQLESAQSTTYYKNPPPTISHDLHGYV